MSVHKNSSKNKSGPDVLMGYIQDEFPCVWQNYNGILTAGSQALRFDGTFFLFDKTLLLKWDDISKVVHVAGTGDVEIILAMDETVHTFRNLHAPEKVWLLLLTLHNDSLLLGPTSSSPSLLTTPLSSATGATATTTTTGDAPTDSRTTSSSRTLRRRNSDPALTIPDYPEGTTLDSSQSMQTPPITAASSTKQPRPVISTVTSLADSIDANVIEQAMGGAGQMLLQPMHCSYEGINGRLYTGTAALAFTGKRFFWEHVLITLPWASLKRIRSNNHPNLSNRSHNADHDNNDSNEPLQGKIAQTPSTSLSSTPSTTATTINYAELILETKVAAVRADGGNEHTITVFTFAKIESAEHVVNRLVHLHNENLVRQRQQQQTLAQQQPVLDVSPSVRRKARRRETLQRMNSDPMLKSARQALTFDVAAMELGGDDDDEEEEDKHGSSNRNKDNNRQKNAAPSDLESIQKSSAAAAAPDEKSNSWTAVVSSPKEVYSTKVVDQYVLSDCTLDQFYETFWSDDASYSLARFLEGRGDKDVSITGWSDGDQNDRKNTNNNRRNQQRVVRYTHPVNAPLAPPEAAARKEQSLQRYGSAGVLIQTQTFVDGVPMADCFYVADRIFAEPVGLHKSAAAAAAAGDRDGGEHHPAVVVTMEFGLTFLKSTMFKGIITKKTTSEYVQLFEALAEYMSDALSEDSLSEEKTGGILDGSANGVLSPAASGQGKTVEPSEAKPRVTPRKPTPELSLMERIGSGVTVERILLLGVLLLQGWILYELRMLAKSVRFLESVVDTGVGEDGTTMSCPISHVKLE